MSLTIKIYDLQSNELADISALCLDRQLTRQLNQARSFQFRALANNTLLTGDGGDGYPILRRGNRKLLVWEDGTIIFHGRIFVVDRRGGENATYVTVTAFDPFMELGFDSEDRAGRPVRGSTVAGGSYDGNFVMPKFVADGDPISGPALILAALTNSINTGAESDPSPGEGPLPIDLASGTWDTSVPPAVDLSCEDSADWPILIGDFITKLVSTGVCDFDLRPVDPTEGFDPYVMVAASAVSLFGTDRSASVHMDYATGLSNAKECDLVEDFATICNKLYDYLGPRIDTLHWGGNITPGSPGTTVDPSASRTLYGGQFMTIREQDSIGTESSSRPLYLALWNAEQGYRVEPRSLLYITPQDGTGMVYTPPADFDAGDLIEINTGPSFGVEISEAQRVYGYTKTWTREDVAQVSQLLTSADVSF